MSPGKGLGFLRKPERMNVLLSRAQRLLVLVGSWKFFQHQLQHIQADAKQPLGSWRIVMDYLESCFEKQSALKISSKELHSRRTP